METNSVTKEIIHIPIFRKHNDVFKQELTIFSRRVEFRNNDVSIHRRIPIDVLYKSNPSGEQIFLVVDGDGIRITDNIILNIDGKKNIKVKNNYADLKEERLEITKEQLFELCKASSLMIQINGRADGVLWEGEANRFITLLQALYNEAIDDTMFTDAKKVINSYYEEIYNKKCEELKQRVESKQNEKLWLYNIWIFIILIIVGAILLGFLLF